MCYYHYSLPIQFLLTLVVAFVLPDSIHRNRSYPLLTSHLRRFLILVYILIYQYVRLPKQSIPRLIQAQIIGKKTMPVDKYAVDNLLLSTALIAWMHAPLCQGRGLK